MTVLLEIGSIAALLVGLAFVGYLLRTPESEAINRKGND